MENYDQLKLSIKELAAEQLHMSAGLRSLIDDNREIKNALLGDKEFQRPGIIHEFNQMKKEIENHENEIKNIKDKHFKTTATVGAVGVASGFGIKAILTKAMSWFVIK